MNVFLKLNFEEPQEYFFNGYVNNEESNDIDLSVKELNENPTIILDSGYETINGMQTLKEGVTHPFNLFSFGFGFKSTNTGSYWRVNLGSSSYVHSNDFQIKLDGSKITFSGMVIFKTSVKDECFKDLVENIENTIIDECSIMKIIDQSWNGKKQFRFTYTGGDWKRDNEIKESIVNNENKSSRVIGVEYAKSLKKSWTT
jgi:hypothetical protein